jgi:hypothetical protein
VHIISICPGYFFLGFAGPRTSIVNPIPIVEFLDRRLAKEFAILQHVDDAYNGGIGKLTLPSCLPTKVISAAALIFAGQVLGALNS